MLTDRPLVLRGVVVQTDPHQRLNLTDMWKAAGRPPNMKPYDWTISAEAERFLAELESASGISQSDLGVAESGGKSAGSTYVQWQAGLAYAKYLSPAFHLECNRVVRGYMEGTLPTAPGYSPAEMAETNRQAMREVARVELAAEDFRDQHGGTEKAVLNKQHGPVAEAVAGLLRVRL